MIEWKDDQPIFRQLAGKITEQIMQGVWRDEQALPSVRTIAADLKINHLTVMKSYQLLVDEGLIEKKRGQGMFVALGAEAQLKQRAYRDFVTHKVPEIAVTLKNIDMSIDELVSLLEQQTKEKS
ncbi:GntR family transcriptional regulator [Vibrio sp. D404a]|uniref:GntR family transcriptional regulator n=1 Tax=unclassified Vibrio TaxID=2614977 RepID=UPI002557363C|nr:MULTISPECIES: GntR family transcriptional regulator [unclassified Vibrio]MDK9736947.1 GntR family transcriptional regulator [Vibrio sp. D404a]MDK9798094.1 GntR family transcriptional regulator [Vibrio sp. D449a]